MKIVVNITNLQKNKIINNILIDTILHTEYNVYILVLSLIYNYQ